MGRRLKNPSPLVVLGTLAGLGLVGYAGYTYMSEAKASEKTGSKKEPKDVTCPDGTVLDVKTGVCIAKSQPKPADDWGSGMTASTAALAQGVPIKILQGSDGLWNFAYSWKLRTGIAGKGKGKLWTWLRSGDPDYDTVVVVTQAATPVEAYQAAADWLNRLNNLVKTFSEDTNMRPGLLRTEGPALTPYYIKGRDVWGIIGPVPREREGRPATTQFLADPLEWYHFNNTGPHSSDSGCCASAGEAQEKLRF